MTDNIKERLEYLRRAIKAENISYSEIAELQSLAKFIDPSDVELLEWAENEQVPKFSVVITSSVTFTESFNTLEEAQEYAASVEDTIDNTQVPDPQDNYSVDDVEIRNEEGEAIENHV